MTQESNTASSHTHRHLSSFPFKGFCQISEIFAGGLLAANWALPLYSLRTLPEQIPMQYSLTGAINWSASKYFLLMMPVAATISYFKLFYKVGEPKDVLYPLEVPVGNPQKAEKLATILSKAMGLITQDFVLAGTLLLINGYTADQATRANWVKIGLGAALVIAISPYIGVRYLRDNYH